MGKLTVIINGAENLVDYVKKSPLIKKDNSLEIVKKKDDKGISTVTPKNDTRNLTAPSKKDIDIPDLSSIARPNTSNGTSLLSHIARKNNLMQEANDLARQLLRRKDIELEIITSRMAMDYDLATARTLAIEGLGTEFKHFREFNEAKGFLDIDKLNFDLFGLTTDGVQIKNSDDEFIIPLHDKAKKDSEKAIETKAMNKMEIDESMIDKMFDIDNVNPFNSLLEEAQEFLTNMNTSLYEKDK